MAESNIALSRQILRQIGSDANKRFLRNLPVFCAGNDIPSPWQDMLERLDTAESQSQQHSVALRSRRG